jgi:hypothetical protein
VENYKTAQPINSYGTTALDGKIQIARDAIQSVLTSTVPNGTTFVEALNIGSRCAFALRVLDKETDIERGTFVVKVGAE